jgi:hypothetical protein
VTKDARDEALEALDLVGAMASASAASGGTIGIGALAVAALAQGAAAAMRAHGLELDDILATIRTPRALHMPWTDRAV